MLAKPNRLPALRISQVLRSGKRKTCDLFHIIFLDSSNQNLRFAFIVSTKIDKRAVRRNRMRRILSESVRHLLSDIPNKNDYVFVVKKNFSDSEQKDIEPIVKKMIV